MKAYLTLEHGLSGSRNAQKSLGTLYLELYDHDVPKTVSNFVSLLLLQQPCTSSNDTGSRTSEAKKKLGYQGCIFHRIIPGFMAQGGDMTEHISLSSSMKETIQIDEEETTFPDENFMYKHDSAGILSMANSGPNTNGTQFFITFQTTPHLDGKHVVFGHVDLVKSADTLHALEHIPCHPTTNRPYRPVVIVDCGIVPDNNNDTSQNKVQESTNGTINDDDDEINLDDNCDDGNNDDPYFNKNNNISGPTNDENNDNDNDKEEVTPLGDEAMQQTTTKLSKSETMKLRMRQLKQKINQARQLNQQAVREEGESTTIGGRGRLVSKRSSDIITNNVKNSQALHLAQQTKIDPNALLQPAYDNLVKQQKKQEKDELNQFDVKDYHNPEGQYRNYERNIRSLPTNRIKTDNNITGLYDPADVPIDDGIGVLKKEREAAHIIAMELHRRIEKRQMKDRKRKQEQIRNELNDTGTSSAASSGINLRNQKFNEKIARTFDPATSEIRHNLERGTAL
jgi:cyclophilin family peptidyl-prolyl cis-trans isomerase